VTSDRVNYHFVATASPPPRQSRSQMTEIECSICLCEYSLKDGHIPLSLECGHAFGMSCLRAVMASRTLGAKCPQCRREIRGRFDDLKPDYKLLACLKPVVEDHILTACTVASGNVGQVMLRRRIT
jgi:hypothetical protein